VALLANCPSLFTSLFPPNPIFMAEIFCLPAKAAGNNWPVCFSCDGRFVCTGGKAGTVAPCVVTLIRADFYFSIRYGGAGVEAEHVRPVHPKHQLCRFGAVLFRLRHTDGQSPDGKHLAWGAMDGSIGVFDITTGKPVHKLSGMPTSSKGE
jgi:hypothetical protein